VVVGPVFDTIKRVQDGLVLDTIDREQLRWPLAWACTPQHEPQADPPAAEWFEGAAVVE
jgi:2-C-methyl-D-erythritol 4-phosphate cytidylyltransferase